jgi:hypothetical protein
MLATVRIAGQNQACRIDVMSGRRVAACCGATWYQEG